MERVAQIPNIIFKANDTIFKAYPMLERALKINIPRNDILSSNLVQLTNTMSVYETSMMKLARKFDNLYPQNKLWFQANNKYMNYNLGTLDRNGVIKSITESQKHFSYLTKALHNSVYPLNEAQKIAQNLSKTLPKYLIVDAFRKNTKMEFTEQLVDELEFYAEKAAKKRENTQKEQINSQDNFTKEQTNQLSLLMQQESLELTRESVSLARWGLILAVLGFILTLMQTFDDEPQVKIEIHNHINQAIIDHQDYDYYEVDINKIMDTDELDDFSGGETS